MAGSGQAGVKVETAVEHELATGGVARVIVITRPDPEIPGGGASFTAPRSWVAQTLSADPASVKQLGSAPAVSTRVTAEQLERLRDNPNVEAVIADIPVPPSTDVTIQLIGADVLHGRGIRGTNRAVAILDTGIDPGHPGLAGAVAAEACFSTSAAGAHPSNSLCPSGLDMSLLTGAAGKCASSIPGCDHGTHVAGIVAGRSTISGGKTYAGVSPGARLVPIQVFSVFTSAADCQGAAPCVLSYPSDQYRALDWVLKRYAQLGIASVNMSLGGGYFDKPCDSESALTQLIERLRAKGVLTVIAAGNSHFYDAVSMPGCISSAVTVAGTTRQGVLDISYSNVSSQIDVAAPGTAIMSSVFGGAYKAKTGTSMAAPHVAGAIALLREQYPDASADEIEARLEVGAPTVVDQRTGLTFARLDLARGAPGAAAAAATPGASPADVEVSGGSQTMLAASGGEQSFLVQSSSSAAQLSNSLNTACQGTGCEIKQIGADMFKVDIGTSAKIARSRPQLQPQDVQNALKSLAPDTKVFANTPAGVLAAPK